MTILHTGCRWISAIALVVSLGVSTAAAQDSIARAKEFYITADYEEALQVLDSVRSNISKAELSEVTAYKVFCLVALGRSADATSAISALVRTDPLYHPSESQASPRVRTFFEDVRRPMLPEMARVLYAHAKDALGQKDPLTAAAEFDRVILILDEVGSAAGADSADLRMLATGFRDLSNTQVAAMAPPPPPAPVAAPAPAPAQVAVAPPKIYDASDFDIVQPVTIVRNMPPWNPSDSMIARQTFRGTIELVIDEKGRVTSATLVKSVQTLYDASLLQAAVGWSFRPATRAGEPVRFRRTMDIVLQPTR